MRKRILFILLIALPYFLFAQEAGPIRISVNKLMGVINGEGKTILNPVYESISNYREGIARITLKGKQGIIDSAGNVLCDIDYDKIGFCYDGLCSFQKNGLYGAMDNRGRIIIEAKFEQLGSYFEGLMCAKEVNGKWGFIDMSGEMVIKPQFDISYSVYFSEGLAPMSSNGKYGYIDHDGRFVIEPRFSYAANFKDGAAVVKDGGAYRIINKAGEYIIGPGEIVKSAYSFSDGLCAAKSKDGKWGFINILGEWKIKPQYDDAKSFCEGMAAVLVGRTWGFIDGEGKMIIEAQYSKAMDFSYGYAAVLSKNDHYWRYINKSGESLGDYRFDGAASFQDGTGKATINGETVCINAEGKAIWSDKQWAESIFSQRCPNCGGHLSPDDKKKSLLHCDDCAYSIDTFLQWPGKKWK